MLNAGDLSWSSSRNFVTNANGATTLEAPAQAGVSAINFAPNAVSETLSDGSVIDGETTFTRTNGTARTARRGSLERHRARRKRLPPCRGDFAVRHDPSKRWKASPTLEFTGIMADVCRDSGLTAMVKLVVCAR